MFTWVHRRGPPWYLRGLGALFPGRQIVLIKLHRGRDGWSTHVEMMVHEGDEGDVLATAIDALTSALQAIDPSRVTVEVVDMPTGSRWPQ